MLNKQFMLKVCDRHNIKLGSFHLFIYLVMFSLKIQNAKIQDHTQFRNAILGQQGHHAGDGQQVGRGWRQKGQHKSRNNKYRPTFSSRGPCRGGRCRKTRSRCSESGGL